MKRTQDPDRKPSRLGLAPAHVPIQPALPGFARFFATYPWAGRQAAAEAGPLPLAQPSKKGPCHDR